MNYDNIEVRVMSVLLTKTEFWDGVWACGLDKSEWEHSHSQQGPFSYDS